MSDLFGNVFIEFNNMNIKNKKELISELARKRKAQKLSGYASIGDFENGVYDLKDNVTPWTNEAGNLEANLMIVGQDWASVEWLSNPVNKVYAPIGRNPNLETNKNLDKYLKLFGLRFEDVYATNAFVFIKNGKMSARVPTNDFLQCVKDYLIPQIEIVHPKMVICLGAQTLNGLRKVLGYKSIKVAEGHLNSISYKGIDIYGAYHTGGLGTASAGGKSEALKQWEYLVDIFNKS